MLRVTDRKFERLDRRLHLFHSEDRRPVAVRGDEVCSYGEALAAEEDVGDARVRDLGGAGLLVEVECDVAHVGLHLGEVECEFVVSFVPIKVCA